VKIVRIEAIPFAIPYLKPLRFASGEVHSAEHVLVRLHTDEGIVGVAEAPPRPFTYGETQIGIVAVIEQILAPQIVGLTLLEREVAIARMARTVGNPTAKAALDMAMWDAFGRTLGLPVSAMLGGFTNRMRVSHMLGFDEPAAMVGEAQRMIDSYGIRTFKVKVGRRPVELDTAVVRALREHFGDSVELYVDGNRGWTPSESLRAMNQMADLDLMFAEELCPADDVLGRRWLVERVDVPFIADESVPTPADVTREVLTKSATAISIKTARTGFTGSRRVHHLAEGLGLEVVMGNQIDGQLGTACTVTFGAAYQLTSRRAGELSNFLDMSDDLLTEPLQIRDGVLHTPSGAGLGIEIDPGKLDRYRADGRTALPTRRSTMTSVDTAADHATAAASGASATKRFQTDKSPYEAVKDTPPERVDQLARQVLSAVHETIRQQRVTYDEYNALKAWLIQVGQDGEWPLFLDVWVEHVVEDVATAHRTGNKGSIEGPYYVPNAPELGAVGTLPMRAGEKGTPLAWHGTITSTDGTPLAGKVELWHADADAFYSQFAPGIPKWNLRGSFSTGPDGKFTITTIRPAPYQIPTDGSCGKLISAAGWHAWRPAHLHVKVSAPGHELLTAQVYFPGDPHNDDDIATAVKPELMLDPVMQPDGRQAIAYDFVLDPVRG
jgi:catechol 1,2-dioxygenase